MIPQQVAAAAAKLFQLCPTLRDPIDSSPPGSPVPGILQAGTLERVAMPSCRGPSRPGMELAGLLSPALPGGFFTTSATITTDTFYFFFLQFSHLLYSLGP